MFLVLKEEEPGTGNKNKKQETGNRPNGPSIPKLFRFALLLTGLVAAYWDNDTNSWSSVSKTVER